MSTYWDVVLRCPGLSHLVTGIFLRLDLDSLANAGLVCKSWRNHIIDNAVWRQKLMILARDTSYDVKLFSKELIDCDDGDKEDLSKKCQSLCKYMVLRWQWLCPKGRVTSTMRKIRGFQIDRFAVTPEDNVLYAEDGAIWLATPSTSGEEWCNFGRTLLPHRHAHTDVIRNCLDVHGDHAVVGSFLGIVAVCEWRKKTWLSGTRVSTGDEVYKVKFGHDGDRVASVHKSGAVVIWCFPGNVLVQRQRLEVGWHPCPDIDLSSRHLVFSNGRSVSMFAVDEGSTGDYVKTKELLHEDTLQARVLDVVILRSVPSSGIGVVAHDDRTLSVWDLDKGDLLKTVRNFPDRPDDPRIGYCIRLSECRETGILAVAHWDTSVANSAAGKSGITLVSTAALLTSAGGDKARAAAVTVNLPYRYEPYTHAPSNVVATPSKVCLMYSDWGGTPEQELAVVENEVAPGSNAGDTGEASDRGHEHVLAKGTKYLSLNS